ncbi:NAD(+) kinase [Halobellus salinus]|uniref:NAD kinase n=1 Tax=Halobellus salinus TaxID=931585 RepID=A0A830EB74_9EURY|nr:NAD(+)/NADH kinase [Halobellus salinus]GGJ07953.1 NAD(+) kinase [Halobellus salinus]SMP27871.1 NAD+ kinase [Halobellus salinus]
MQVAIVAQWGNDRTAGLAADIRDRLREAGVSVWLDDATAERFEAEGRPVGEFHAADLVVSIGGDGTFLFAAHGAGDTPILGVNLGEVGFLNPVRPDDAVDAVLAQVRQFQAAGSVPTRSRPRLTTHGDGWTLPPAVNEVVVQGQRRGHGGGADLAVQIDGSAYSRGHADGVLIATPTGSTAYNLSEDGPLVHPGVSGFVVTGMAATRGMPPLVVDADSIVSVSVEDAAEAVVVVDGRIRERVEVPTEVTVRAGEEPLRTAGPASDFFEALEKLD